jgi:hypothetical protein
MAAIDRLGWAAGGTFEAYGVRVGLRANDEEAFARARQSLPPSTEAGAERVSRLYSLIVPPAAAGKIRRFNILYADAARLVRDAEPAPVYDALAADLKLYVAEHAKRRVFVHAGVVGWRGRALLIPGKTFTGKSTLVAALLRAGATYYSDEYAVLDARGRVHPYATPLSLRGGDGEPVRRVSAASLGAEIGSAPLAVGWIFVGGYRPGARFRPRAITPGRAMLALFGNAIAARSRPDEVFAALKRAVAKSSAVRGRRGEAVDAVADMIPWLNATEPPLGSTRERARRG